MWEQRALLFHLTLRLNKLVADTTTTVGYLLNYFELLQCFRLPENTM
ncbi:hypothetical protein BRADI_3g17045v3 [Brachypodium distachyon]|uniref:Uncharacterized protein n=1 Tax=Brachypodium distachyon TaxID=15368 RepID=A0A0Q3I486_BRADI|nr:hypothetical protein BRADI_3g17045v3 [Brachypodium distachyon]